VYLFPTQEGQLLQIENPSRETGLSIPPTSETLELLVRFKVCSSPFLRAKIIDREKEQKKKLPQQHC
jgi:hypothetical protein